MKLQAKLISACLGAAAVTLVVGGAGWYGTINMRKALRQTGEISGVAKTFLQREIDHLNWARKAEEFQRDENVTEVTVE